MPLTTDQLIAQSKQMLAQTAAEGTKAFAGSSYDTVKPTTPTITAASLAPQTPIQPVQTEQPQVPVVSPYALTADETQAETQETDLSKLIAGLTAETSTPFQEDARLKAEEAQGISAKKSALAGLQNTQKSLLAESQGIQLQLQQDIQNQQNLAQQGGANVTKGGLAPQTRALQTVANQSLLSNAIKQYGNNASLAAAQGDLASAMDYVDRAIQAEFLPKEKALAVAQANLTNLQKSGTLTRAQQKRADERQALIDAQKAALAEEKAIKTDTRDAVVKAISNNTGLPGFDNLDIAALQAAQTPEEVAAILQARGLSVMSQQDKFKQDLDTAKFQQEQQKMDEDTRQFNATYKQNQEKIDKVAESAGLTPYQVFTATQSIAKDNQKRTENAREISRQVNMMDTAYKNFINGGDKNTASQAIISTFNKILDPTSVVRESEYDRTAAGQSLLSRIEGKYNNISEGGAGVTKETLKSAVDLGNEYLKNAQASILKENERSTEMARQFGLDPSFVSSVSTPQEQVTQTTGNIVVAPDGTEIEIID